MAVTAATASVVVTLKSVTGANLSGCHDAAAMVERSYDPCRDQARPKNVKRGFCHSAATKIYHCPCAIKLRRLDRRPRSPLL
jgi:hypothetical protein